MHTIPTLLLAAMLPVVLPAQNVTTTLSALTPLAVTTPAGTQSAGPGPLAASGMLVSGSPGAAALSWGTWIGTTEASLALDWSGNATASLGPSELLLTIAAPTATAGSPSTKPPPPGSPPAASSKTSAPAPCIRAAPKCSGCTTNSAAPAAASRSRSAARSVATVRRAASSGRLSRAQPARPRAPASRRRRAVPRRPPSRRRARAPAAPRRSVRGPSGTASLRRCRCRPRS